MHFDCLLSQQHLRQKLSQSNSVCKDYIASQRWDVFETQCNITITIKLMIVMWMMMMMMMMMLKGVAREDHVDESLLVTVDVQS